MALGALGDHARQERLDAVDRSPQIHGHEPLPVGVAHFDGRSGDGDTGVVEENVHRAVPLVGGVGEPIDVTAHADIAVHSQRVQLLGRNGEWTVFHVGQHQMGAFGGQQPRSGQADA